MLLGITPHYKKGNLSIRKNNKRNPTETVSLVNLLPQNLTDKQDEVSYLRKYESELKLKNYQEAFILATNMNDTEKIKKARALIFKNYLEKEFLLYEMVDDLIKKNNYQKILPIFKEIIDGYEKMYEMLPKKIKTELEDLENEARGKDLADDIDFKYIFCPQVVRIFINRLEKTYQKFPEIRKKIRFIGASQSMFVKLIKENPETDAQSLAKFLSKVKVKKETSARAPHSTGKFNCLNGITINSKYVVDNRYFQKERTKITKFNSQQEVCNTIKVILDHEIGHQIDKLLQLEYNSQIKKIYEAVLNNKQSLKLDKNGFLINCEGENYLGIKYELSAYASKKNNILEFIADAWAEYCNNKPPRRVAELVGKIIENEYVKKYQNQLNISKKHRTFSYQGTNYIKRGNILKKKL